MSQSHLSKVLDALRSALAYPHERTVQATEFLYVVLQGELEDAATDVAAFGRFVEGSEPWEVEEEFTRTFDVNPACALEVGWHLFGEEYARGMFLVRMRQEMRKYGLPESAELPDHITHVLAVLSAMPADEAARFAQACVLPAVAKMNAALSKKETPYRHLLACLQTALRDAWGSPGEADAETADQMSGRPFVGDPLHAFPVADVDCTAGECGEPRELVSLEIPMPASRVDAARVETASVEAEDTPRGSQS